MPHKIALIGPGAIGGTLAAWLLMQDHNQVVICSRTPFQTLHLESPDGVFDFHPTVVTDPADVAVVDWVVVATKTYHLARVAGWLERLVDGQTKVAVVQNGVEHVANMAPYLPTAQIVPVIIDCPAERMGAGQILQRGLVRMTAPNGPMGQAFSELFPRDGVRITLSDDWNTAAWKKLCINCGGAISALVNQPANIAKTAEAADVMRALIEECILVGRAEGAIIEDTIVDEIIAQQARAPDGAMNSIHADLVAKRPMEWDTRNGIIVRLGQRHGIPTPYNRMATALLRLLDRQATPQCPGGMAT